MTRDRRTFLREITVLGCVPTIGGLSGCLSGSNIDVDAGGDGDGAGDGDGGGDRDTPAADALVLRSGLTIGMLFTALGGQTTRSDVDPDQPGGGRLITVDSADPSEEVTISWRETIEREITPTATGDVGVGTTTPTPEVEIVERTGTVTATGLAAVHKPFLPMFWEPEEVTTETSAMWLSQEAFQELTETRQTAWSRDVLTRISWVGKEVQERIHDGVEEVDEVYLEAKADFVDFDLTVDGQRTTVQAIKAHDSFGNEYIILANDRNPLVLKFTYNAVSVGFTGFDTALWSLIKAVFSGYQVVSIDTPSTTSG